jgi:hypothetical protein
MSDERSRKYGWKVTLGYPCCKCCRWEGCPGPPHRDPCIICGQDGDRQDQEKGNRDAR